jgi:hypothetical protein
MGEMQAALAASPAFSFQSVTASALAKRDQPQRRRNTIVKIPIVCVFILISFLSVALERCPRGVALPLVVPGSSAFLKHG